MRDEWDHQKWDCHEKLTNSLLTCIYRTSSGNAIRRTPLYPACMILLSSSSVQKSISKSSPMSTGGTCSVASVFFCSSVLFAHPLLLILNTSSILLPIREVQRTQNDLFVRLRGRVYETREQKSHICNNRTNYEILLECGCQFRILTHCAAVQD